MDKSRVRLRRAAQQIAANRAEPPATTAQAFRKLFVQERRDWRKAGAPRIGWKRGELVEFVMARSPAERAAEWGDVGYYVAQTWRILWYLYVSVTPRDILERACGKMERRAKGK